MLLCAFLACFPGVERNCFDSLPELLGSCTCPGGSCTRPGGSCTRPGGSSKVPQGCCEAGGGACGVSWRGRAKLSKGFSWCCLSCCTRSSSDGLGGVSSSPGLARFRPLLPVAAVAVVSQPDSVLEPPAAANGKIQLNMLNQHKIKLNMLNQHKIKLNMLINTDLKSKGLNCWYSECDIDCTSV